MSTDSRQTAGSKQTPASPTPTALTLHSRSRVLEIAFDDEQVFMLPYELLRVYSPSAEVRGHGSGQEVLQIGKREVTITGLEPVGNYAVQPVFSDGHYTGLYSWEYLYRLGFEQATLWADYLQRLQAAGYPDETGRDAAPSSTTPPAAASSGGSCGHKH